MSETPSVKKKGLQPKDLINIGIFTALYFIIIMAVAMLGYVPIFIPLLSVICPLIGGIPYMLYITKVRHFGMVFIMGTILGLLMGLGGMGVYAFITGPVCGLLADLVLRSGNYNSAGRAIISHGVLSVWLIGNYIPIVMNRASYFAGIASGYGQEYANALSSYIPDWSLLPLALAAFIAGCIGAVIGKKLLHQHFERAGIA